MNGVVALFLVASLALVPVAWLLPRERAQDAVALLSLLVLAAVSPLSAAWLGGSAVATPFIMRAAEARKLRGLAVSLWGGLLVVLLLTLREIPGLLFVGAAYFTLRHLQVLFDWWTGELEPPTLRDYLRFHLFLPALAAGPIHRFQNFQRQLQRRRWEWADFYEGAERLLFGAFQLAVLGSADMLRLEDLSADAGTPSFTELFLHDWKLSCLYWVQLYFSFAGLTSIAIGLALMQGIRLEENFNAPWKARNLVEFWTRWHMTLSNWCRDYVFRPVTAVTRMPVLGVFMALVVMGVWHQTSAYWLLWGLWQGLGVALTRLAMRPQGLSLPPAAAAMLGPLSVFAWLSLARPVITAFGVTP